MTEKANKPPCKICGGAPDEHEGRQHAYTTEDGQLLTQKQKDKLEQSQQGNFPGQLQPMAIRLPGAQTNEAMAVGRLCEILLEKGLLTASEALYVAGMSAKPDRPSGFADPAMVMEVKR